VNIPKERQVLTM